MTAENLKATADRLREALDAYHRLVDGWPYESETVPAEVREYLADRDGYASETDTSPAAALAAKVKELYYEAREVEASYVEQARRQDHPDWFAVIVATKPVREVARQVHAAGYGVDSETGEARYLLPPDLCPAHLVSMNDGSTPVTYADRVAQYRAVGDHFDLAPDVVYHPGSGHDVSPSAAFPESRVVYVDVDEAAMDDLARAGYEAVGADATGHELATGADVIVFRNAGLVEEAVVDANLRPGGWVLANDHLESARHLARMDTLELIGVIPDDWTGESPPVVTGRLDGYLSAAGQTGNSSPDPPFVKGTPLDLYVFRDDERPGLTRESR
ncbi:hypothetical protein ACFQMA_08135 [Halosimplex aquaticum]|uniref:Uncharacterized protein n=1 Tax=Halosimplex aquaticum TaxID=3026162 RepID=A0ABD5Y0N8_9EURY|nr:hypothetical protein [Halosimplex aquaticum]